MKKELQEKLFKKYPDIFRQKETPGQLNIECGDGWYELIDLLCEEIQNRVNNLNIARQRRIKNGPRTIVPTKSEVFVCEAAQVKQKFGGLRFYTLDDDDFIKGLIAMATTMSYKICELCGNSGSFESDKHIKVRCVECQKAKSSQ